MKNDGGQAVPRAGFSGPVGYGKPDNGMALRDWLAGQAIMAVATYHANDIKGIAKFAYELADALIAERAS